MPRIRRPRVTVETMEYSEAHAVFGGIAQDDRQNLADAWNSVGGKRLMR